MIAQLKEYAFYKPSNCTLQMGNGISIKPLKKTNKQTNLMQLSYPMKPEFFYLATKYKHWIN